MQNAAAGSLVQRMVGAARLDPKTYEEVERDTKATTQAAIVVVLAAIAVGIGSIRENGGQGLIGGIVSGLLGWAVFSQFAYFVGTRFLAGPQTKASWGEVLRTLGFAYTPTLVAVVGFVPVLGPLVAFVGQVWFLIAAVTALRHAFEVSTGRAVAIGLVAILAQAIMIALIAVLFGISLYGVGSPD